MGWAAFERRPRQALEEAVRPFVARAPAPFQARPDPAQDEGEAVLEWSARMPVQVTSIPAIRWYMIRQTEDLDDRLEEVDRLTNVVRVTNPEDASQYVDVEIIDEADFLGSSTGRRTRYVMNNQT